MHSKKISFLIYILCLFICCLLFVYSAAAVQAAREGVRLWYNSVMPALLPFFVCAYILQNLSFTPLEKASQIFLCLISGAPAGARLTGRESTDCTRTVAILNTVSPMFIYAAFCCEMINAPKLAVPIIAAQVLSALLMLRIFKPEMQRHCAQSGSLPMLLSKGLTGSVPAMLGICAAMVFFMAVMAVIGETGIFAPAKRLVELIFGKNAACILSALVTGMLEMVSGARAVSCLDLSPQMTAALAAFVFSFGGLCIFAQSITLCALSFKVYFSTKLMQAAIAAVFAYILALLMGGSKGVFNTISTQAVASNALSLLLTLGVSLAALSLVVMLGAAARLRKRR